jgi:beta-galactosidase
MAAWPNQEFAQAVLARAAKDAGLATHVLPEGLRLRRAGEKTFAFNYSQETVDLPDSVTGHLLLGQRSLGPAEVSILKTS